MSRLNRQHRGLFVTGTDTEVGKTYVAALLARHITQLQSGSLGVYKPVASGCQLIDGQLVSEDAQQLWEAAGRPLTQDAVCPQRFAAPVAPHVAAASEQRSIDERLLLSGIEPWHAFPLVLVEGAGGLMSPLSANVLNLDLAKSWGYPLLIVAANRLGVLNHVLLTLEAARHHGLQVAGLILNDVRSNGDASASSNWDQLQRHGHPPLLTRVRFRQDRLESSRDWTHLFG